MTLSRHFLNCGAALALLWSLGATSASAETLFWDQMNADSAAGWGSNVTSADTKATFGYNYSAVGIPEAPNSMGGDTATSRAMVQSPGYAYQLPVRVLKEEFQRGGATQGLLLRYAQVLLTQAAQTAVCNRHHSVDQQLCRRLLLSLDRMLSNELMMTQELIASMLGVRREGITEAAGRLQDAGMIEYRRGRIRVLDRPALQSRCCECYAVVKAESERLLAQTGTY